MARPDGFIERVEEYNLLVCLKARQLGMTWVVLCYAIHTMIFRPAATVLLFSQGDTEAMELLSRLKGIYERLPRWAQCDSVTTNNAHEFGLSNGSVAKAFSTSGGRSFTGSLVLADESDYISNLSAFLNAVKPTVDAGGKMILLSTSDKKNPVSTFKNIYRDAVGGKNNYHPVFYPWTARPDRTQAWYDKVAADMLSQDGSTDNLYQEYPATDEESLAPNQLDKRFAFEWIKSVTGTLEPIEDVGIPGIPGLTVYKLPEHGHSYVLGVDPAEGNPNSDTSACVILDERTYEEVAVLAGKFEPSLFAEYISQVSMFYNDAPVMVERNNHGHAVLLELDRLGIYCLVGHDGNEGWATTARSKVIMCSAVADVLRAQDALIHSPLIRFQLADFEAASLSAPDGMNDDFALAFMLSIMGCRWVQASALVLPVEPHQISDKYNLLPRVGTPIWAAYDAYAPGSEDDYLRSVVMAQIQGDSIVIYDVDYSTETADEHFARLRREYVSPEYVIVSRSSQELRSVLARSDFYVKFGFLTAQDGLREGKRGFRHVRINPRCERLLADLARWRYAPGRDMPNKQGAHGGFVICNLLWNLRGLDLGYSEKGDAIEG